MENLALRICALAVLYPSLKPLARPFARWLLKRYP
jgi:hypothetical protein